MLSAERLAVALHSTDPKDNSSENLPSGLGANRHTSRWCFPRSILALLAAVAFATALLTGAVAQAQDESARGFPGVTKLEAPVISPLASERELRARAVSMSGRQTLGALPSALPAAVTSAAVAELARGLRNDPDLIYEFVYNNVSYAPIFGYRKGPAGTLIDREGNSFDQAALMVALLRESGYTANFVYGTIRISAADLTNWLGVSNNADAVATLLGNSGVPAQITSAGGTVSSVDKSHVWVKVNIDGADYVFDPAFKTHDWKTGIDVGAVLGYDRTSFINNAMAGAVLDDRVEVIDGTTFIIKQLKQLNKANISSNLASYATNLINHIKGDPSLNTLDDVIGGESITPLPPGTSLRQTSLPHQQAITAEWAEIPDQYKPTLRVEYQGMDQTFFADTIYGKRLTLFFNAANEPVLRLDGAQVAVGTAIGPGQSTTTTFTVDNPYAALGGTFADQTGTGAVITGAEYLIANSFGNPSRAMVEEHRRLLGEAKLAGGADDSEPVLGEALSVMANNWMAQNVAARLISDRLDGTLTIQHHTVGLTAQYTNPYTDVRLTGLSIIDLTDGVTGAEALFNAGGVLSATEGGMLEQIHSGPGAATISMLDVANAQDYWVAEMGDFNWFWMKGVLRRVNYPDALLNEMEVLINAGYRLFAPVKDVANTGAVTIGNWTGHTYMAVSGDEQTVSYFVNTAKGGVLGESLTDAELAENVSNGHLLVALTDVRSDSARSAGDPVDMFSGKFTHEHDDIAVGSAKFPFGLGLQRYYHPDIRFRDDGPMGRGWTHNFNIKAVLDSDSFQGLGEDSALDATSAIAGLFVSLDIFSTPKTLQIMTIGTLVQDWYMDQLINNTVRITRSGNQQEFVRLANGSFNPPPGKADFLIEEANGSYLYVSKHGVKFDFDADGKLLTWQDPNGVTVTLSYGGSGKLQTVDNGMGRTLTFNYTGDQITEVLDGNGRSVSYSYDADGNLSAFTDTEGHATTYTYTAGPGLLTEIFRPSFPSVAFITNTYDTLGRVKEQRSSRNFLWQYLYGVLRTEEINPLGETQVWEFNRFGRNIRHVDQIGNVTVNEYDGLLRLKRTMLPEGNTIEYEYDGNHNVERITANPKPGSSLSPIVHSFVYDQTWNKQVQFNGPLGQVTDFVLDPANGNLKEIRAPEVIGIRPTTLYTYNSNGQILTVTDPEGKVTLNSYDPATANLLSITEDDGRLNLTTVFGYDAVGNVTSVRDANGRTINSLYDNELRLIETSLPAPFSHVTKTEYDEDGRTLKVERETGDPVTPWQITSFTYDAAGNRILATVPGGHISTYEYDELDRLKKVTDAEGRITETMYDPVGRVVRVVETVDLAMGTTQDRVAYTYTPNGKQKTLSDAKSNTISYDYDGFDRLEGTTYPDGSFAEATYDANGNVKTRRSRAGEHFSYDYDTLNRLLREDVPYSTTDITYTYDLIGRILTVADESGTITHDYNTAGGLKTVTQLDGKMVVYDYDANGNRIQLTWPDNWFVTYHYDELDRVTDIKENGTELLAHYDYDALSRRTLITYGNGTTSSFDLDPDDNDLNAIDHTFGSSSVGFAYTYNQNNERISEIVTDDLYLWRPDGSANESYTPNNLNQYSAVGGTAFAYDGNGNLTDDGYNTYSFDAKNRLIQAVNPQHSATYQYDAFNRRVAKTVDALTTEFLLDGVMEIAEYDGPTDALLLRHVYGPGMTAPLVEISAAGSTRFLHTDAIGSVVAVTGDGSSGGPADPQVLNPVTGTPQGGGDLTIPGFTVQAADDRILLVAVDAEVSTINGATFGGAAMTQVGQVINGLNTVVLYELREAALGAGAQSGDIVLDLDNTTGGGVQVTAWTLTGVDQSATPVVAQAFNAGTAETTISASITTTAESSIVVGAFGLGDPQTWAPGAGETQIGYASSGSAAGGASYELVGAGTHDLSWTGPSARRPTLLLAAYAAAPAPGGGFAINNPQTGSGSLPGYTVGAGDNRVLIVGVATDSTGNSVLDVSFGGTAMTEVMNTSNLSRRTGFFHLPESALGVGAVTGDITVDVSGSVPAVTEIEAFYLTDVDQSQLAQTSITNTVFFFNTASTIQASLTTLSADTAVISAFSVDQNAVWASGADETEFLYNSSGSTSIAASYELAPSSGTAVSMSWTGASAARPTILMATYGLLSTGGGGGFATPGVQGAQTATSQGEDDVTLAGYTVPAGADRILLVAVDNEDGTINGVTFGGQALSRVGLATNGLNDVALYELREAAFGAGAQVGDIVVQVSGASSDGKATQVIAFTATGVDQAAAPVLSQSSSPGTAETSITANITTTATKSLLVSAFGLGDQITWTSGTGETQAGYAGSGSAAGGASTEVAGPGTHDMSWSGPAAGRPTLLVAAYAAAPGSGGSAGNVVERYAYGPHGEGLDEGLGSIAFRYAGHRYDPETKLVYMRARYYSVAIGRFLSPDPIGYADGFNLYTYAANSPLNFIDPTGLAAAAAQDSGWSGWDIFVAVGEAVGGLIKGIIELIIGEDFGAAWGALFTDDWVEGQTGGFLPESWNEGIVAVQAAVPTDASENGMHAWHAGTNAYFAKKLGLVGAPLIILAGIFHETPLDWGSFSAEQFWQGSINHFFDSFTDLGANLFGLVIGYVVPGNSAVNYAIQLGNYIPGPGEPDPAFGGGGIPYAIEPDPSRAWGHYPD